MKDMRQPYFCKQETIAIKGLLAIMVLLHHLYQQTHFFCNSDFIDYFFRSFGYIAVSGFFFLSGYGITYVNNQTRGGGILTNS